MTIRTTPSLRFAALLTAAALALTGCATTTPTVEDVAAAADAVTIENAWVKAADEGMSAAFGEFVNDSDADVTITAGTTAASDMLELHETTDDGTGQMVMREVEGGFTIPAHGSFTLEPGGNHLMLMGLTGPLQAGDEVTITVTFSDDSSYEFAAPVKDFTGANEEYDHGGSDDAEHEGH